jgi:hypothetical protein
MEIWNGRGHTVSWYACTVNEVGPASDASDTPGPVVYINLTDKAGSFANTWFYAANGIQEQLLDVGIAAINGRQDVEVGATSPLPGNNPYTEISRIYGLRPQPPKAPTDFHEISITPPAENSELAGLVVGWKDNSSNEDSFVVRYSGTRSGSLNAAGETAVAANSVMAILSLDAGYTYNLYVAAVNSAGEAASNTITVTMPASPPPMASLSAAVGSLPTNESNFGLSIEGNNFGASEMVEVTVDWKVGDEDPASSTLDPQTTNSLGSFQVWFASGVTPDGICPISVPDGESQPPQRFSVSAAGLTSGKTASATAGPFTCPD